jgi:hypothetical protein
MGEWRSERVAAAGILHAAAAEDSGVAWACGISVQDAGEFGTLIFRRDRQGWQPVEAPQIGRVNQALAVSEADVWAVGDARSLRWDGVKWREVPTAPIKGSQPQFFGLAHFGADDVWTAGYAPLREDRQARGAVQHWDGTAWNDLPMPDVAAAWSLSGIAGASPADLWAVGRVHEAQGEALTLHWDGQGWQRVAVPGAEGRSADLSDVAVLTDGQAWAAGYTQKSGDIRTRRPFTVRWDGQEWSPGEVPDGYGQITKLATDGRQLWGLGYVPAGKPYAATLQAASWHQVAGPAGPPGARRTSLHSGTILPDGSLLAVGASSMPDGSAWPLAAVLTS